MSAEAFATSTVQPGRGDVLGVSYGDDSNLLVEFYTREVEDEKQTGLQGRVILKPVAYCKKQAVGDPRTVWDAPATDTDKARWPLLWSAYERGEHDFVAGTPLEAWPGINRDMRVALKNIGFKTVEQIAGTTDGTLAGMGQNKGNLVARVRDQAKKFIEEQESGAMERRLMSVVEEKDNKIGALEGQLASLAKQMEEMREQQLRDPIVKSDERPTLPDLEPVAEPEVPTLEALEALPEVEPVKDSRRKLSDTDIMEITHSTDTVAVLAERYGVSKQTISRYRKG